MTQYKACTKCNQVKTLDSFGKSSASKSGLKPLCKSCKANQNLNYRKNNSEKIRLANKSWYEKNTDKIKQYKENRVQTDSGYSARKNREYHHRNKTKMNAKSRAWRALNYDKARELEKVYRLNNPEIGRLQSQKRRALKRQGEVFKVNVKDCQKMLNQPCFYCGTKAIHLDHVIPLVRGGRHSIGNLVPSCSKCNTSKNKKTIMEWRVWKNKVLR